MADTTTLTGFVKFHSLAPETTLGGQLFYRLTLLYSVSMQTAYIISGYGVPKNITKDTNMQLYLRGCFNHLYDALATKHHLALVVLTGGRTDLFKPYRKTEAGELAIIFRPLMQRQIVQKTLGTTKLVLEKHAISLVENLVLSKKLLQKHRMYSGRIVVFCEKTRTRRTQKLSKIVFGSHFQTQTIGIDFDVSANRYRDPKFLLEKESKALHYDLWALKSSANLRRYHKLHADRLRFLRKSGNTAKDHIAAINQWWKDQLAALPK